MNLKKMINSLKSKKFKVVRIDENEFELEDGTIYPNIFNMGDIPSIEEFQKIINNSQDVMIKLINEYK